MKKMPMRVDELRVQSFQTGVLAPTVDTDPTGQPILTCGGGCNTDEDTCPPNPGTGGWA